MKAMILAAGLGTRMGALGVPLAKPALPVLGEPLVLRLARSLAEQGVDELVVNTHAHPESIREALRDAPIPVSFSHEPRLRGSGGGIAVARRWLSGSEPFLVVNGDMLLDLDVAELTGRHAASCARATLLLREDGRSTRFGSIGFDEDGLVRRITDRVRVGPEVASGLFCGVHVLGPDIFDAMPDRDEFDSVLDVYVPLLRSGARIGACVQRPDQRWWPVGTPVELLEANLAALERLGEGSPGTPTLHVDPTARIEGDLVPPAWVGARVHVAPGARAGPSVVLGARARVEAGARITRAVVLPDGRVSAHSDSRGAIMGSGGIGSGA